MRVEVLDHGYVELVEHWGSDERIIEAARMSTGKGFLGWGGRGHPCPECREAGRLSKTDGLFRTFEDSEAAREKCSTCKGAGTKPGDEKLLRFLWENKHATPFEMAGLTLEVQAPIFVFREWHRHRTQSYNELSARYTPMPATDYVPTVERLLINAGTSNKQAGTVAGSATLDREAANEWLGQLEALQRHAQEVYDAGLRAGVPKELARLPVTVSRYSRMRASANLRNWLAFLSLRMAPGAQWEIRQYANTVGAVIAERFPRTWDLFCKTTKAA
jgi:thymidylate synthase (FAD)